MAKSGIRNTGIILQQRDRLLLSALRVRRFVDRKQASDICGFRSASRAKARLLALARVGHVGRMFVGTVAGGRKAIYFLPGTRRRRLSRTLASPKTELFIEHQLAVNAVIISALRHDHSLRLLEHEWPAKQWQKAPRVKPDAVLELHSGPEARSLLIEIDLGTESMRTIREKVSRYLALARSGESKQLFGVQSFRVLFVVRGRERLLAIRNVVACETARMFWFVESEAVTSEGFWARVWLRPTGEERHSLI